jgi:hypothetical protein
LIGGIDLSSKAIDVVLLDEDTNRAEHYRVRLDTQRGDATERIRRLRDLMPARGAWSDLGITMVALERPIAIHSSVPLMVYGALLQVLPSAIPLLELRSDDWRTECGIAIRKPRDAGSDWHKREALRFAREQWLDCPPIDHDAADAFCIAWAAREIDLRTKAAA